ncbi:hypothetical protein GCM10020295_76550 [Streptomyces cinereospinus]
MGQLFERPAGAGPRLGQAVGGPARTRGTFRRRDVRQPRPGTGVPQRHGGRPGAPRDGAPLPASAEPAPLAARRSRPGAPAAAIRPSLRQWA